LYLANNIFVYYMPSRTRRNYRGGGPLETCQAYLKKNNLGENIDKCPKIIENVTFTPGGMFGSTKAKFNDGGSPFDYTRWANKYDPATIEKNKQDEEKERMQNEKRKQDELAAEQARIARLPQCNGYNKTTNAYVYKPSPNTPIDKRTKNCKPPQLCTKWSAKRDNRGNIEEWFVTDNNGNVCDMQKLPKSPSGYDLYNNSRRPDYERLNPNAPVPLVQHLKEFQGVPISYADEDDQYNFIYTPLKGGKRSRRRTRKSRR
jgi:hypothetical protein